VPRADRTRAERDAVDAPRHALVADRDGFDVVRFAQQTDRDAGMAVRVRLEAHRGRAVDDV
jgi:hypothetical protein